MKDDDSSNVGGEKVLGVLILVAVGIFLIWLLWLNHVADVVRTTLLPAASAASSPTDVLTQLGQAGDAFGSLNALFAGLATALVAAAAYLQNQQLRQAQKAYDEERKSRLKQEFEATFFKMLDLSRELVNRIQPERVVKNDHRHSLRESDNGTDSLEYMAKGVAYATLNIFQENPEQEVRYLITVYRKRVFGPQPSTFGPYWRVLFQTFKLIDESALDQDMQVRYANIARGQLSEGAVFLLALNGLSHRGYKFIRYHCCPVKS